jgi:hypothetical protein
MAENTPLPPFSLGAKYMPGNRCIGLFLKLQGTK